MNEETPVRPMFVGMLTGDPLRLDGMQEQLGSDGVYRVLPLEEAERRFAAELCLAVVDVAAVVNLESLIREFRRRRPQVRLLVLGAEANLEQIISVVSWGAKGYLSYTADEKEWRMALDVVREGSIWAPRKVLALLLERRETLRRADPRLTPREEEVLHLLVQGRPNRQIADALGIDETTVKAHLGRLMRKLGVRNRVGLTMAAVSRFSPGLTKK